MVGVTDRLLAVPLSAHIIASTTPQRCYCRQMYANARVACAAHEKEMKEARARIQAQRELAAAQAQAAQRALTVAREKAAHEAKSE